MEELSERPGEPLPNHRDTIEVGIWIANLQAGIDRESNFNRLFQKYYKNIYNFFAKRGFSREESLDLTQETFLNIHNGISSFRREGHFESWMFQIATNLLRNKVRYRRALKRRAEEESLETYLDQLRGRTFDQAEVQRHSGPLQEYLESEQQRMLADALSQLPKKMRRCVVLRFHHELKYHEIATVMQVSIETVKAHLFQARRRLKTELFTYFKTEASF